jgi:hypothetical protein
LSREWRFPDWEALAWAGCLLVLALSNPDTVPHRTLFLPSLLFGIRSPGYGLGHSISYLLHGDLAESLRSHWLGIPATLVLVHRILHLTRARAHIQDKKEDSHAGSRASLARGQS